MRYDLGNPIWEKNQLEGEVVLLSFLWYITDVRENKETLFVEFPLKCGTYGHYRIYPPILFS
jgi:hypothetical protein